MKAITLEGELGPDGQLTAETIDRLRAQAVAAAAQLPLERRAAALEGFEKMLESTRESGLLTASASSIAEALTRALKYLEKLPGGVRELARALDALRPHVGREVYTLGGVGAQISMAMAIIGTTRDELKELLDSGVLDGNHEPKPNESPLS
jgi:hypothetical protein